MRSPFPFICGSVLTLSLGMAGGIATTPAATNVLEIESEPNAAASALATSGFKLLSQPPGTNSNPTSSSVTSSQILQLPTVRVTYSGISATWARRLARVLAVARASAKEHFGFDMPDEISLSVTVAAGREYKLYNDMRDQVTYNLRSEADLAGFESQHWYFLYGMSHEVAHLAMYRSFNPRFKRGWLNWDAQEAWAHYLAGRLVELSYIRCVSEFWPGHALNQLFDPERESAQQLFPSNERQLAEHWRALADIVADRGIQPLFEQWSKVDADPAHASNAVLRTFIGHAKAEQLNLWWLKAAPLMLTQPGKSVFPPAS